MIVVDDASGDDSPEIARSIDDSRLQVSVNETNLGTYGALSRALDQARGEFVAVLNTDDWWAPDKLERQLAAIGDAAYCYTLGRLAGAEGEDLGPADHADWPLSPRHNLLPWLVVENRALASSVLFRRGAASFDPTWRYSGDWRLLLDLSERSEASLVAEPLVHWRQHPTNSYVRGGAVTLEEIRMRRMILARYRDRADLRGRSALSAMHLGALYVLVGRMDLARAALAEACRLDPLNRTVRRRRWLVSLPEPIARTRLWRTPRLTVPLDDSEEFEKT